MSQTHEKVEALEKSNEREIVGQKDLLISRINDYQARLEFLKTILESENLDTVRNIGDPSNRTFFGSDGAAIDAGLAKLLLLLDFRKLLNWLNK